MWAVYEHRRAAKRLGKLPIEVLKRYEKWKDIVALSGPQGLRAIKGFHDEALHGERFGQRSSRLGGQHRVIYEVDGVDVRLLVLDVTAHDYRMR